MAGSETLNERLPLSTRGILFLGICVTLGSITNGINYTAINVTLDEIAKSLKVKDGNLQWAANSYLLAFVSGCNRLVYTCTPDMLTLSSIALESHREVRPSFQGVQQICSVSLDITVR